MEHTLLIAPMRLFQPERPLMLQMMMFLWTLLKLCKMKQKAVMRKRHMWQLCHKEAQGQQPILS